MKYTATTLMSVLLVGVCSARILHTNTFRVMGDMSQGDVDYSKPAQYYPSEGGQRQDEEPNSQQMSQLKDTVYRRLRNAYQQLNGKPYNEYLFLFDESPVFDVALDVGSTVDRHDGHSIHYDNVKWEGLNSTGSVTLRLQTDDKMASLVFLLRKAEVFGHYKGSDNHSGNFKLKMTGHLTYADKFRYEIVNDTYVRLMNTSAELYYNSYISNYENAGSYPPSTLKDLQRNLLQLVNEKIHEKVYAEYSSTIQYLIQHPVTMEELKEESVESVMRKGIQNAVSGIQQAVSKHGAFSMDLTSDNQEMVYNKLHAKISSLKLKGIDKFYLAGNHVSNEIADRIRAKVELAIDRPTATAVVSIHEAYNEDAPFQKINVDFEMEQLMANLWLDKSSRQSGLELRSIETKVNRIWPVGTEKFDGQVSHLIQNKLAGHVKQSIEEGLKSFLQNQLDNVMRRGNQMRTRWE